MSDRSLRTFYHWAFVGEVIDAGGAFGAEDVFFSSRIFHRIGVIGVDISSIFAAADEPILAEPILEMSKFQYIAWGYKTCRTAGFD